MHELTYHPLPGDPSSGTCRYCGCTEEHACHTSIGECWWVDPDRTICSACIDRAAKDGLLKHLEAAA